MYPQIVIAVHNAKSEPRALTWVGSLSEISSVRGEGWHCESEKANHTAASGSGRAGHREPQPATLNSWEL